MAHGVWRLGPLEHGAGVLVAMVGALPFRGLHVFAAGAEEAEDGQAIMAPLPEGHEAGPVALLYLTREMRERLVPVVSPVSRPALRYHGGKWRLGTWVSSFFPEHHCYVEPFGGSAAVLLRKEPSPIEVWNDLNKEAFNFFTILRTRTADLAREIELTEFGRAELEIAFEPSDDPLERARRWYVRAWQCMGGPRDADTKSGWRFERHIVNAKSNVRTWNQTSHLWAAVARLKAVQFDSDDAFKVIRRFDSPETLFYLDPPYVTSTRGARWRQVAYRHEFTDNDHRQLAALLHRIQGHAVISGYRCDLYDRLYEGWRLETKKAPTEAHTIAEECLWISPPAEERRKLWREKRAFGQLEMTLGEGAA